MRSCFLLWNTTGTCNSFPYFFFFFWAAWLLLLLTSPAIILCPAILLPLVNLLSWRAVHTPCRMSSLHTYFVFARSTPTQDTSWLLSQKLNLHTSTIQPFKKSKNPGWNQCDPVNNCPKLTLQHTSDCRPEKISMVTATLSRAGDSASPYPQLVPRIRMI